MASNAEVQITISLRDRTTKQLNTISSATKKMGSSFTKVGKSMTRNLTLPLLAIGVAGVKMASDLDLALRDIQSITGRTDAEIKELSKTMIDMSTDMEMGAFSAEKFTRSLFDVESAGFSGAEALEILAISSRSATAGQGDLKSAVNTTLSVLKAYNLKSSETARINDELAAGVRLGKQTFDALSTGVRNTAAIFSAFEIPVTDSIAALTLFANKGVDAATAATRMNAAVFELNKPSAELAKLIKAAGFETGRTMLATLGFVGTMEALNRVSRESNVILSDTFLGRQAAAAVITLTGNNMQELISIQNELKNSTGEMGRSFDEQAKSFDFQVKKFMATLQELLILIGQHLLPILIDFMEGVKPVIEGFSNLDEGTQKIIIGIGALVAVGGPLLIFLGSVFSAVGAITGAASALGGVLVPLSGMIMSTLIPAMGAAATAASAMGAAMWSAGGPIAALIAALVLLGFTIKHFGPEALNTLKTIGLIFSTLIKKAWNTVKTIGMIFGAIAKKIGSVFPELARAMVQVGINLIKGLAQGLLNGAKFIIQVVSDIGNAIINTITGIFGIASPSKIMIEIGSFVGDGFNKGIEQSMGLISGINAPKLISNVARAGIIGSGLQPSMTAAGGGLQPSLAAAGGGGDVNFYGDIIVPAGTPKEAVDFIWQEIADRLKRKGITGAGITNR